jgi:hypothetical protein
VSSQAATALEDGERFMAFAAECVSPLHGVPDGGASPRTRAYYTKAAGMFERGLAGAVARSVQPADVALVAVLRDALEGAVVRPTARRRPREADGIHRWHPQMASSGPQFSME